MKPLMAPLKRRFNGSLCLLLTTKATLSSGFIIVHLSKRHVAALNQQNTKRIHQAH